MILIRQVAMWHAVSVPTKRKFLTSELHDVKHAQFQLSKGKDCPLLTIDID